MRDVRQVLTQAAASTTSIALAQTLAAAGPLTINGALAATSSVASGGIITTNTYANLVAPNAPQTQVTLTSSGNDSAVNFTITGTDYRGIVVSEVLAGPNADTVTSVNSYATIISVVASAAVSSAVSAGNAGTGSSPVVVVDKYANPFDVTISLTEGVGTWNVTVQYTMDGVFGSTSLDTLTWFSHSQLTAQSSANAGTVISALTGIRLLWNSGTGSVVFTCRQPGGTGAS